MEAGDDGGLAVFVHQQWVLWAGEQRLAREGRLSMIRSWYRQGKRIFRYPLSSKMATSPLPQPRSMESFLPIFLHTMFFLLLLLLLLSLSLL